MSSSSTYTKCSAEANFKAKKDDRWLLGLEVGRYWGDQLS